MAPFTPGSLRVPFTGSNCACGCGASDRALGMFGCLLSTLNNLNIYHNLELLPRLKLLPRQSVK